MSLKQPPIPWFILSVWLQLILLAGPVGSQMARALRYAPLPPALSEAVQFLSTVHYTFGIVWLLSLCAPVWLLVTLLCKDLRRQAIPTALVALVAWCSPLLNGLMPEPRVAGLDRIVANSGPAVAVIERYRREHGSYPDDPTAQGLLSGIYTGAVGYPRYDYERTREDKSVGYTLRVPVPQGFLSYDIFVYHSNGDYEKYQGSDRVERWGRWIYIRQFFN